MAGAPEQGPDQAEVENNDVQPVRRALLSVFNKEGIAEFAQALHDEGVELISTGGTAKELRDAGLPVTDVEEVTGFPSMLDGRVKTLDPHVFAGLLADRENSEHMETIAEHQLLEIDLVCVNLYPFEDTVASTDDPKAIIEKIDVGGPSMIRAGAKNHGSVVSVCNPDRYDMIIEDLRATGGSTLATRIICAADVFQRTAAYEAAIGDWFHHYAGEAYAKNHPEIAEN